MKKILFTLACLLGMSTAASAIQSAAVMLQHDGKIYDKFVKCAKSIFTNEKQAIYSKCRK